MIVDTGSAKVACGELEDEGRVLRDGLEDADGLRDDVGA